MRKLLKYAFAIFTLSFNSYSQDYSDSIKKNWKFFTLNHKTKATVIEHIPNSVLCGTFAFASITIVKTTKGKTFRVLNLCSLEKYVANTEINIVPSKTPLFDVLFPSKYPVSIDNQQIDYNQTIQDTTWGIIETKT